MCGIAGIYSTTWVNQEGLAAMTDSLAHRGPDVGATWIAPNQQVGLGHRRLSIIDLSTAANQPFHSTDNRYTLVFNGEIYNFRELATYLEEHQIHLRTKSDTEVILEGYIHFGIPWISRLEGMFAFAIYDSLQNELLLVRDRLGKKPLFIARNQSMICFASELKALRKVIDVRKINQVAVHRFLHLGYIPAPDTIWSEVEKFPAGHYALVRPDLQLDPVPYWQINAEINGPHNYNDPVGEFKELLTKAVSHRLIADVPIGAFLSGGTDSSLITAFANKLAGQPVKTFSIGFVESAFNEIEFAEEVAKKLGTDHESFILQKSEALELLDTYTRHFDEPFADTSAIPMLLVSGLARKKVKVVLTGDGGDELFMGYGSYTWANRLYQPQWRLLAFMLSTLFKRFGNTRFKRVGQLLDLPGIAGMPSHIFSQEQYFFSQKELFNSLLRNSNLPVFEFDISRYLQLGYSPAMAQSFFDLAYYLSEDLLAKVDRTTMFHGLEARSPLLDKSIVSWSMGLNEKWKVQNGQQKVLLKTVLSEFLPHELVHRKKWGFSVPLAAWLKRDLLAIYNQYTDPELIEAAGLVKAEYVTSLKIRFERGETYLYNRIWAIIVLHKWWSENCQ